MYPLKYDLNELFRLHEEGWLKMSRYKDQLYIFCYSPACQYEKHWTPITLAMRGMVLGRQGQVIGQCLPKFFNLCEVEETRPENLPALPYEIFQKIDGSYTQSFYNPYEKRWQHSSKCSFDNEYIDAAYRFLPASVMEAKMDKFESLISEVRFDEDPMRRVTDAPSGLYAITSWRKFSTQIEENPFIHTQVLAHNLGINQVEEFDDSLQEKLESFNGEEDTEGYVVRFRNGFRTKLKTAWYLRLNRAIDDFDKSRARDTVKTYLTNYNHSLEWIKYLPDELWEEAKEMATRLLEEFESKVGVVDKLFETHYSEDRKTFALAVKDLPESPYLFSKFNGKDYKSMIWEKL